MHPMLIHDMMLRSGSTAAALPERRYGKIRTRAAWKRPKEQGRLSLGLFPLFFLKKEREYVRVYIYMVFGKLVEATNSLPLTETEDSLPPRLAD